MGLALVKTLQKRKGIIRPIILLAFLNALLLIVFLTVFFINLNLTNCKIFIYQNLASIQSVSNATNRIIVPVQLNSYYCEVLTLSWILLYGKLGVYEYSEFLK
jgi:hypothetical protein